MKVIRGTFLTKVSIDAVSCVLLYNNARMEPRSDHYQLSYAFVFSLFLTPPPLLPIISFGAHTYVYVARVRVMLNASKIPHYRMHDVTVSAAVTSFEFLVSEIFNANTPPKTYTC
jgi:hypothetical protein